MSHELRHSHADRWSLTLDGISRILWETNKHIYVVFGTLKGVAPNFVRVAKVYLRENYLISVQER